MTILNIVIILFITLETSNILMLYFTPETRKGNGMGAFKAYDKSKSDPEIHRLVGYLVNWVAGTKLIFIILLIVILVFAGDRVKLYALGALILSVASFYWRLYPMIRKMDGNGEIEPKGYSRTLAMMIGVFIAAFIIAAVFGARYVF